MPRSIVRDRLGQLRGWPRVRRPGPRSHSPPWSRRDLPPQSPRYEGTPRSDGFTVKPGETLDLGDILIEKARVGQ